MHPELLIRDELLGSLATLVVDRIAYAGAETMAQLLSADSFTDSEHVTRRLQHIPFYSVFLSASSCTIKLSTSSTAISYSLLCSAIKRL